MAWLYVPALAASNSDCISPSHDIALSVTSNGKPTRQPLSWRGWKTRPWIERLYGTISKPSQAARGVDAWISSLQATRASLSAWPASDGGRKTSGTCGRTSGASPRKSGRGAYSLKTSPGISRSALTSSIESYRALVTRLRRDYRARQKSARHMSASAFSSWPTPIACQARQGRQDRRRNRKQGRALGTVAAVVWPSPQSRDWKGAPNERHGTNVRPLNEVAKLWGTPSTMDAKGRAYTRDGGQKGAERAALVGQATSLSSRKRSLRSRQDRQTPKGGQASLSNAERSRRLSLNPFFVEWLMGWPLGWTDCASRGMEFARWLQRQRIALSVLSWNYETEHAEMQQLALIADEPTAARSPPPKRQARAGAQIDVRGHKGEASEQLTLRDIWGER